MFGKPKPKVKQMNLRWEKFDGALSRGLHELFDDKDLVDVTLACQGEYIQAHKNVLSVCSSYFKKLFKANPCTHPIVILQEAKLLHVKSLLQFIYCGETSIPQNELAQFLRTAETLKVRGLSDSDVDAGAADTQTTFDNRDYTNCKRKRWSEPEEAIEQPQAPVDWSNAAGSSTQMATQFVELNSIKGEALAGDCESLIEWSNTSADEEGYENEPIQNLPSENINSSQQDQNEKTAIPTETNSEPNTSTDTSCSEKMNKILVMQKSEKREDSINELVVELRTHAGGAIQHRDSLPCKTVAEILQLEETLANDKEHLTRLSASLGLLGGKNPYQAVRRTFAEVIGHEVAEQYRWSGSQSGKRSITSLPNVLKLITNASILNPASRSMTITEVENILKVWLRSSGDREGGRNRRRRKELEAILQQQQQQQQQQQEQQQQQQQQSSDGNSCATTCKSLKRTNPT